MSLRRPAFLASAGLSLALLMAGSTGCVVQTRGGGRGHPPKACEHHCHAKKCHAHCHTRGHHP
jgi:hypothetical protein